MDYQQYEQIEKNLRYIASMRPVFNKRALFSDMTADYISPQEPEPFSKVKIRFRSAINNVDYVLFVHNNESCSCRRHHRMNSLIITRSK